MEMVDVNLKLPQELVAAVATPNLRLEQALWQKIVLELLRMNSFFAARDMMSNVPRLATTSAASLQQ